MKMPTTELQQQANSAAKGAEADRLESLKWQELESIQREEVSGDGDGAAANTGVKATAVEC